MKKHIKVNYILTKKDKELFKKAIKSQKITSTEFCKRLDISATLLCYLLNGERALSEELVEKFKENGVEFEYDRL